MYTWKYDERWNKNTAKSIYSGPFIGTPSIPIVPAPIFQLKLQDLIISMWSLVFNPLLLAKKPRWIRFFFFSGHFFSNTKTRFPPKPTHRISGRILSRRLQEQLLRRKRERHRVEPPTANAHRWSGEKIRKSKRFLRPGEPGSLPRTFFWKKQPRFKIIPWSNACTGVVGRLVFFFFFRDLGLFFRDKRDPGRQQTSRGENRC